MKRAAFVTLLVMAVLPLVLAAQQTIPASEARKHVGERVRVCGKVASIRWAVRSRGQPTFINLDRPYPKQVFTIVIWGRDRAKFGEPEKTYRDKVVCVTGEVRLYRGVPEIVAREPKQITLKPPQQ